LTDYLFSFKIAAGGWRRLHDDELRNLYPSPNVVRVIKSRRVRWVCHVACMRAMGIAYKILVGKPEEISPPEIPLSGWEGNIRMDFRYIRWEGVDWMHLAQDRD
jgi:hypothetical protein